MHTINGVLKQVWITTLFLATIVWSSGMGNADDIIEVQPIRPVPNFMLEDLSEKEQLVGSYGLVYRIGKDAEGRQLIVIDDQLMYYAPNVDFHYSSGVFASPFQLSVGSRVGYSINTKDEVTDLYILDN